MNSPLLTLIALSFLYLNPIFSQVTLVDYGSVWSYYDAGNQPVSQNGQSWNSLTYDASSWSSGPAHMGYGDNDESTIVSSNTDALYVRRDLFVSDPSDFDNLSLDLIYDDGAVVYLNGNEVWRVNMPGGSISYGTFSSGTSSDNSLASESISSALVQGNNVIAVEIHQASNSSSDISFDMKVEGIPEGSVAVNRGPYLQKSSHSAMTIKWRTTTATSSRINYGTSLSNLNQNVTDNSGSTDHEIEITGLSPNTVYYYEVADNNQVLVPGSADQYFKTAPSEGASQPITAWILGDCGTANNNQRAVRDAYYNYIGSNHTDMILFLGDNAYNDGTDSEYQTAVFENMYEDKLKNSVSWSCLGNHDGYTANSNAQTGPYYDIFSFPKAGESGGLASGTEAYYSFNYGNIHFISLDSYETDRSVGGAMYSWAQADIQNTTAEWIVAFWHHPPYTKGSHDSDSESNLIQMRQNFLPMLEDNGVDLVLSGHSHSYERSYFLNGHYGNSGTFNSVTHTVGANGTGDGRINGDGAYQKQTTANDGAVYITAGSSGKVTNASLDHNAMYYSVASLGSCILEVDGDQMDVKFIRETGDIDDYFTIQKTQVSCTVGDSCDDGDACTANDQYDSSCDCIGTLVDSDNDGVCDAQDTCPGLNDGLIGTPCDDGDICTTGDKYNVFCDCQGTFQDGDNDGICDAEDQCPILRDDLIGMPCDDADPCTIDDVWNMDCNCKGTFEDSDNDGICDVEDTCPNQNDNLIGTSCDDGDDCTVGDVYDSNCDCTGTYQDVDGDGYCAGVDPDDNDGCIPDADLDSCNPCNSVNSESFESGLGIWIDGGPDCARVASTANTGIYSMRIRDNSGSKSSLYASYDLSAYSAGSIMFSYFAKSMEIGEDFFLELSNDGGAEYTTVGQWVSGTHFQNNIRYNETVSIPSSFLSSNTFIRFRADASTNLDQVFLDDITLEGCQAANCSVGMACDDQDDCTTNDSLDFNCNCTGAYVDEDNDGVCQSLDPDDSDPCNPISQGPGCGACGDILNNGFETGMEDWIDGGRDCNRFSGNSFSGLYSVRLRDDNGVASSMFSKSLDLSAQNFLNFNFSFTGKGMDTGDSFVFEISTDGGFSFSTYQRWISGTDFQNINRYDVFVQIADVTWSNNVVFRLRCDAPGKKDLIYIDDVILTSCLTETAIYQLASNRSDIVSTSGFSVYPVPAVDVLTIDLSNIEDYVQEILIYNTQGKVVKQYATTGEDIHQAKIDVRDLTDGVYIVGVITDQAEVLTKKMVVLK